MIYKAKSATPTLGGQRIKISKIMPSFQVNDQIPTQGREEHFRDSFAHLAIVEYRTFNSSRIRMGNLDVATSDYFRKENWWSGRLVVFQLWRHKVSQP